MAQQPFLTEDQVFLRPLSATQGIDPADLEKMRRGSAAQGELEALKGGSPMANALRMSQAQLGGVQGQGLSATAPGIAEALGTVAQQYVGNQQLRDMQQQAQALRGEVSAGQASEVDAGLASKAYQQGIDRDNTLAGILGRDALGARADARSDKQREKNRDYQKADALTKRKWQLEDAERDRGYQLADQDRKELWALDKYDRERADAKDKRAYDLQAQIDKEQRQYDYRIKLEEEKAKLRAATEARRAKAEAQQKPYYDYLTSTQKQDLTNNRESIATAVRAKDIGANLPDTDVEVFNDPAVRASLAILSPDKLKNLVESEGLELSPQGYKFLNAINSLSVEKRHELFGSAVTGAEGGLFAKVGADAEDLTLDQIMGRLDNDIEENMLKVNNLSKTVSMGSKGLIEPPDMLSDFNYQPWVPKDQREDADSLSQNVGRAGRNVGGAVKNVTNEILTAAAEMETDELEQMMRDKGYNVDAILGTKAPEATE